MTRTVLIGVVAALALSCRSEAERVAAFQTADSAGVRVVTHLSLEASEWSLAPEPELDLGTVEGGGPDQFFRVSAARRLDDGAIAVFNGGSSEVRVFREDGTHELSFGGQGQGPGEFLGASRLWTLPGDSFAIWDTRLRRLSVFDRGGALGRTVSPEGIERRPQLVVVFPDGGTLFEQEILVRSFNDGLTQQYSNYVHFGPDGAVVDSLPRQPRVETVLWGEGPLRGPPLFGQATQFAGDSTGYWIGAGKADELVRYSLAGTVTTIVRWPAEDRAVGLGDADLLLQEQLSGMTDPDRIARDTELHNGTPVSERYPPHGALFVDRLGALWMQEYERPGRLGPSRWYVFGSDGVLTALVDVPAGHRIFDIGEAYVLASGRDELDVEHVRLFRLVRSRP